LIFLRAQNVTSTDNLLKQLKRCYKRPSSEAVSIDRYNSGPNVLTEISHDQDVDGRPEDICASSIYWGNILRHTSLRPTSAGAGASPVSSGTTPSNHGASRKGMMNWWAEMESRGMRHRSPLKFSTGIYPDFTIDREASLRLLLGRCPRCAERMRSLEKGVELPPPVTIGHWC